MTNSEKREQILRVSDVAAILGVSQYSVREAIKDETILIPYLKSPRGNKMKDVIFQKKDVMKFIPWRKKHVRSNKPTK